MSHRRPQSQPTSGQKLLGGSGGSCEGGGLLPALVPQHRTSLRNSTGRSIEAHPSGSKFDPSVTTIRQGEGMNVGKRGSDHLAAEDTPSSASPTPSKEPATGAPLKRSRPNTAPGKTRRVSTSVSFCKTAKPPSASKIQRPSLRDAPLPSLSSIIMKHSASCTALPRLASPSDLGCDTTTAASSACAAGAELDLTVSPAAFVRTIVLQSKALTAPLRGEDVVADAARRASSDAYYLPPSEEHLGAYTNDKVAAVQSNDLGRLRSLHASGREMRASNRFGESLLHTSCRRGHGAMVDFFVLEAGVSPRVRDDMGRTPMHDACWSSAPPNHGIMRTLIRAAPELLLSRDKRGHSPFDYARREYWPNWVAFLNEHRQLIVSSLVASCLESSGLGKVGAKDTESEEEELIKGDGVVNQ